MLTTFSVRRIEQICLLILFTAVSCGQAFAQRMQQYAGPSTSNSAASAAQASTGNQKLPLRRVVLYKSGVGYFEHAGRVRGNEDVEIDLTSSQLDDVLKSLTALDLNGGRIVGASYNSQEPGEHQLQSLPVPVAGRVTLVSLLEGLRGARLEVRTSTGVFSGRLLGIQQQTRHEGGTAVSVNEISLLGEAGDVRSFALDPGTNLRFTDRELQQELGRALGLLDSSHQEDTRHLLVSTTGTGEREVQVSYTSEVPVWKTTYRIVLPAAASPLGAKPLLQGWAVVDNTVGEDWDHVELSLAAGAPQSFIQKLSQPYYTQRPTVPLPRNVLLAPQTHGGTMVSADEENRPLNGQNYRGNSVPSSLGGLVDNGSPNTGPRQAMGYNAGGGVAGRVQAGIGNQTQTVSGTSGDAFLAAASSITAAQGAQLGDLFEYKLKDLVTIRKNQSALVPIVQAEIVSEKVSLWNAGLGMRPLRALWFTNTSSEVLDGGTFSVFDGGAFGGEGLLESIQPGEKRLISYAADLGMRVVANQAGNPVVGPEKAVRIQIAHGLLIRTVELRNRAAYTIRNEDDSPRILILEHPIRTDWKLASDLKPEEQSATAYRFRIEVSPKQTKEFTVEESHPTSTSFTLTNMADNFMESFVSSRELPAEIEKSLRQILAQKDAVAKIGGDLKAKQAEVDRIAQDQERVRENMKVLKGTPEEKALTQRYIGELAEQETQLGALRNEIGGLGTKEKQAQQELDKAIEILTFDAKL